MVFCSQCGEESKSKNQNYCSSCGSKLSQQTQQDQGDNGVAKNHSNGLREFLKRKSTERTGFFSNKTDENKKKDSSVRVNDNNSRRKKTKFFNKKNDDNKQVTINVGLMKYQNGSLVIVKGSKLPIQVLKKDNAGEVLQAAVTKYAHHNQYFCGSEDYILLYPDQKVVSTLPGVQEEFTIEKYKIDLGKPFSKIDLYMCTDTDFDAACDNEDEKPLYHKPIDYLNVFPTSNTATSSRNSIEELSCGDGSISSSGLNSDQLSLISNQVVDESLSVHTAQQNFSDNFTNTFQQTILSGNNLPKPAHTVYCPCCNKKFDVIDIELHVDTCLQSKSSLFDFDDFLNESENEEKERDSSTHNDPERQYLKMDRSAISLKLRLLIQNKLLKIDSDSTMTIEVRRQYCFADFIKHFEKPWNLRKRNSIYSFSFLGESGVDTGGVSREFFDEALQEVKNSYFNGDQTGEIVGLELNCGTVAVTDGTIRSIGHLFAASICNGGPGPGYLQNWMFRFLSDGMKSIADSLPKELTSTNVHFNNFYNKLILLSTDEEIQTYFKLDSSLDFLSEIGFRGNPSTATLKSKTDVLQSVFIKAIVEPILPALTELAKGLECYDVLTMMKENKEHFEPLFCPSEVFVWDFETFRSCLSPQFSDQGSIKNTIEINVYKFFLEFVENLFMDESYEVRPNAVMKFLTGCSTIPPIGSPSCYKVFFKHDCQNPASGISCKCFPIVSTCAYHITIPVHIHNDVEMKEVFACAIKEDVGFGRC